MKLMIVVAVALTVALTVRADEGSRFRTELLGANEVPSNFTPASGTFDARVVKNDTAIQFTLTYENLSGPPLVAHIHIAERNVSGGVSIFLCGGGAQPACPPTTSGTVVGTATAANVTGPAAQGIAPGDLAAALHMIRLGLGYTNMHTSKFPTGEIRGQLKVTGD